MRERVGVLGGTFDPVHLGHLRVAEEVKREPLLLERVLLVPSSTPPHKQPHQVTAVAHRLAMLRLAVTGREGLEVSTVEIDRGGTSFTIDTLRALRDERCLDPVFILGMDALLEISTWRDHVRLREEFDLVVVDRSSEAPSAAPGGLDPSIGPASRPEARGGRILHLRMEPVPVSSREIRELAAAGAALDGLVPPSVARYIQEQGLYRQEGHR